jgi:hypothetical protein
MVSRLRIEWSFLLKVSHFCSYQQIIYGEPKVLKNILIFLVIFANHLDNQLMLNF